MKWYTGGGNKVWSGVFSFLFFFIAVPFYSSISSFVYILHSVPLCKLVLVLSHPSPAFECHLLPVSLCTLRSCSWTKASYHTLRWLLGQQSKCAVIGVPSLVSPERRKLLGSLSDLSDIHPGGAEQQLCQRACNPVLMRHLIWIRMSLFIAVQKTTSVLIG